MYRAATPPPADLRRDERNPRQPEKPEGQHTVRRRDIGRNGVIGARHDRPREIDDERPGQHRHEAEHGPDGHQRHVFVVAGNRPEDRRLRPVVLPVDIAQASEERPVRHEREAAGQERQPDARANESIARRPRAFRQREWHQREDSVVVNRHRRHQREAENERPHRLGGSLPRHGRE